MSSSVERLAERALRARLRALTGDPLDRKGRVRRIKDAIAPTIAGCELAAALGDVCQGDGSELAQPPEDDRAPRFHSARSSCALAINAFSPWRLSPESLVAFDTRGFEEMRFERKCPVMRVARGKPPNLDVLIRGSMGVLAIESKLIEYISGVEPATIAFAYDTAVEELADPTWREAVARLRAEPSEFKHFAAAQIVKHYLGLRSCFPESTVLLVYLYWEPTDRDDHAVFALHREEIARFAARVADAKVSFSSTTYAELFDEWAGASEANALEEHLGYLRARYELSIT